MSSGAISNNAGEDGGGGGGGWRILLRFKRWKNPRLDKNL